MANALSRRALVLSDLLVTVPGLELLADLYPSDPYFGPILTRVATGELFGFVHLDGLLFKGMHLCVPDCSLRLKLISELHGVGHIGRYHSIELVQRSYFWPTLR